MCICTTLLGSNFFVKSIACRDGAEKAQKQDIDENTKTTKLLSINGGEEGPEEYPTSVPP